MNHARQKRLKVDGLALGAKHKTVHIQVSTGYNSAR